MVLPVTYGGDGRGTGPGATTTPTTLMFPDNSNPSFSTPWNMANSGIVPNDMRFLLASGKFYITTRRSSIYNLCSNLAKKYSNYKYALC